MIGTSPRRPLSRQQRYIIPTRACARSRKFDADDFFGREALVDQLVTRLSTIQDSIAVVGPSGSGKSSVVKAGLIPALA